MALDFETLVNWNNTDKKYYAYESNDSDLTAFQVKYDESLNRYVCENNISTPAGSLAGDNRKSNCLWYDHLADYEARGYFLLINPLFHKFDANGNHVLSAMKGTAARQIVSDSNYIYGATTGFNVDKIGVVLCNSDGDFMKFIDNETTYCGGVAVDSNGNIYQSGYHCVKKYDSDGNILWSYDTGVISNKIDCDDSNVYVSGQDGYIRKINSSGVQQWAYDVGVYTYNVKVDAAGNVYGTSQRTTNGDGTGTVWKLNSAGAFQWVYDTGTGAPALNYAFGLHVDDSGNVYTTTYRSINADITPNYALLWKIDSAGNYVNHYDNAIAWYVGVEVELDSMGNIYFIGFRSVNDDNLCKLNSSFVKQWGFCLGRSACAGGLHVRNDTEIYTGV